MRAHILIFFFAVVFTSVMAQVRTDGLKRQGEILMNEGRYAEAIDQFNKYISANPRLADGYHLRALCFEKRTEYQYAVLDLRRAIRLEPSNSEIRQDLNRVLTIWHRLLYQKIDGHKRDIAIDPNHAFSYLEIGKSYRWLEEWSNAEFWYDEYLKRDDDASPDEIIRYTEILAKTGSLVKGERILKKFTERYPDDWRIWSRYGYFTYWLGKNKIAEEAFLKALGYKPFFKEAEDGLDLTRRQGYLTQYQGKAFERAEYPIDRYYRLLDKNPEDDNTRFNLLEDLIVEKRYEEAHQQIQYLQPKHSEEERFKNLSNKVTEYRDSTFTRDVNYYTEVLKNNPTDKEAVMKLALAYGNLFYYDSAIEVLSEYLQDIPEDQDLDARFLYAKYSAWNYEWEKSIAQLEKLLEYDPDNLDYQLMRAQIAVWTVNDFDLAEKYLLNIVEKRPKDVDALISLVNLFAWKQQFDVAKKYLDDVKNIAPNSISVADIENTYQLRLMAYEENKLLMKRGEAGKLAQDGNCTEAMIIFQEFANTRKILSRQEKIEFASIASCAKEYQKALELYNDLLTEEFDYNLALIRAQTYFILSDTLSASTELEKLIGLNPEDEKTKLLLADAYSMMKKTKEAEHLYRDVRAVTQDSSITNQINQSLIILAARYAENKQFDDAFRILNEFDDESYHSMYSEQIDDHLLFISDLLIQDNKLDEAEELYVKLDERITDPEQKKTLNTKRMLLGDAFINEKNYGRASDIYYDLLDITTDTTDRRMINDRIGWLPPSGFSSGLSSFGNFLANFLPTNINLSPFSSFYKDNQNLRFMNYGISIDGGFMGFLSLGATWSRTNLSNGTYQQNLIQMKGNGTIFLSKYVSISGSYGKLNAQSEASYPIYNLGFRYLYKDGLDISFTYENNDARVIFYSPQLLYNRIKVESYRFSTRYEYNKSILFSGYYSYHKLYDGNEGNDLQIRVGKRFLQYGYFGYEYYFADYAKISSYYYSPQNYISHSIWGEVFYDVDKQLRVKAGGKVGYVPSIDFIISDIYGEGIYNPVLNLIVNGRIGYGNSFRYVSAYKSFSFSISAYWGLF